VTFVLSVAMVLWLCVCARWCVLYVFARRSGGLLYADTRRSKVKAVDFELERSEHSGSLSLSLFIAYFYRNLLMCLPSNQSANQSVTDLQELIGRSC
jgi:hypothetical protein